MGSWWSKWLKIPSLCSFKMTRIKAKKLARSFLLTKISMSLEKLQWKSKNLNILNSIYTNSSNQNLQVDGDITLKLKSLKMSEDLSFQLMSASNQKRKANYLREFRVVANYKKANKMQRNVICITLRSARYIIIRFYPGLLEWWRNLAFTEVCRTIDPAQLLALTDYVLLSFRWSQ